MTNSQTIAIPGQALGLRLRPVPAGGAVALSGASGRLSVVSGRVWLTRQGDARDHVLGPGEAIDVADARHAVVESWGSEPAAIAWAPSTLGERAASVCSRCWTLMNPLHRAALGGAAALVAVGIAFGLFGPISEARSRSLAGVHAAAVLHNAPAAGVARTDEGARRADGGDTRSGPQRIARQARRGAPGAA